MNDFLMGLLLGKRGGGGGGDAHGIPSGGTTGQVLAKTSGTDYAAGWTTPHYIPSGGGSGQVLAKSSNSDYALEWVSKNTYNTAMIGYWDGMPYLQYSSGYSGLITDFKRGITIFIRDENSVVYGPIIGMADIDEPPADVDAIALLWMMDYSDMSVAPRLRMYRCEYDDDMGDYMWFEISSPDHAVTGTWVGTAAQYAALSPNYDANTIYYIKE